MNATPAHQGAVARYLAHYRCLETSFPGSEWREESGIVFLRYGRPKDGIWREVIVPHERVPGERLPDVSPTGPRPDAYVAVLCADAAATERAWSSARYRRLLRLELMTRPLGEADHPIDEPALRPIIDAAAAAWLHAALGTEVAVPELRRNPAVRFYALDVDGLPVSSAALVRADAETTGIDHVATLPEHRRRGYAARLMRALHAEAVAAGARHAVLAASEMGEPLYRALGYQHACTLLVFVAATP